MISPETTIVLFQILLSGAFTTLFIYLGWGRKQTDMKFWALVTFFLTLRRLSEIENGRFLSTDYNAFNLLTLTGLVVTLLLAVWYFGQDRVEKRQKKTLLIFAPSCAIALLGMILPISPFFIKIVNMLTLLVGMGILVWYLYWETKRLSNIRYALTFMMIIWAAYYVGRIWWVGILWYTAFAPVIQLGVGLTILVIHYEKISNQLQEKQEELKNISSRTRDIIFNYKLVPDPHFTYLSPSVEDIFSLSPAILESGARELTNFLGGCDCSCTQEEWRTGNLPPNQKFLAAWQFPQHDLIITEGSITFYYDARGRKMGFSGILRDVTEERKVQELLKNYNRELAEKVDKKQKR